MSRLFFTADRAGGSRAPRDWERLPPALRGPSSRARASLRRAMREAALLLSEFGPGLRRVVDVAVSALALVLVSPVLLGAALAIKASSRGPVFFTQERLGLQGRPFRMFKLRTMTPGAEARTSALAAAVQGAVDGARFKLRRDPRITGVGRLLRKLSVDELPQLWNVLAGDMTLVGPRPPLGREVALYDARALRRLEVLPGLTCLWQVEGRSDLSFEQQIALDLEYIDRVQPAEELLILAKTIPAVLTGRGAY